MPFYLLAIGKRRHRIHQIIIYCGRYIYRDDFENTEYNKICSDFMDFSMRNFLMRMIIIALSIVAMNIGATHAFLFKGIKTTVIDVKIPYTEEESYEEFFGNIVIHMWMGIYGGLSLLALEVGMEVFIGIVAIAPKLVASEFRKLEKEIANNRLNKLQAKLTFQNIIQQIMDIDEYVN